MMKRWSNLEINKSIDLINKGIGYQEIADILERTQKSVKIKLNKLGVYQNKEVYYEKIGCKCCGIEFNSLISEKRVFCSNSCSATFNNKQRKKKISLRDNKKQNERKRKEYNKRKKNNCLTCGIITTNKYCSSLCQNTHKRNLLFDEIEKSNGFFSARQIKKYLIHKHGKKCMRCGWSEKNQYSNTIPIELEHIDGDSGNNNLNNIILLCPNCHSLTPTYKGLNKGNGRHKRRERYKNNLSY